MLRRDLASLMSSPAPRVYWRGSTRVVRCCQRDVEVSATPEEIIRQRVLRWLHRRLHRLLLQVEKHVLSATRARGRADIIILDGAQRPRLVIECKRPGEA